MTWVVVGEVGLRATDADRLTVGMTHEEVVAELGRPPDRELPSGPGWYPVYLWETLDGCIVVRYDGKNHVYDINSGKVNRLEKFIKRQLRRLGF